MKTSLKAKQLAAGDIVTIRKQNETITAVTLRENHVYVETDYTAATGAGAYDLDKMMPIAVYRQPVAA